MPGSQNSGSQRTGTSLNDSTGTGVGDTAIVRPGQEDDLLEDRALTHGAMGVMYTVCKEKAQYGPLFIAFRLLADWLQLWLLVVQPPQFDLPPDKLWWQIINFIGLNQFMTGRGYTFFLACFYLLVCGLLLSVGLSVWVGWSFQQNRFDHVWPIIILRWFAKIFYQMLDIMSMSLFLMALDCQLFYRPDAVIGYNQEFPDVYCWSMPHLIHVFVAVISLILFLMLAAAFTVGEMELDFTTHNQLAIMHTGVELWTFIIRVLMTFVSVLVYNPKWASVAQLFLSCWLVGLVWYWQLQLEGWVNHVRVGMYTSVAWCSVLYVISAFNLGWDASDADASQSAVHAMTITMWATTVPIGVMGALASWGRLHHLRTTVLDKFRHELPRHSEDNYVFPDSRFAEVLARCCRVWVDRVNLQPDGVLLAEKVFKAGLTQMPKDPFMLILYSSFLMDVQNSYQSGYTQLQAAKKLELSFLMRFAIFSREQQHAQRSAAGAGGNRAADLVSYVEFQRNYSMALKVHRDALVNMQRFWECLLRKTVKFHTLAETIKAMDTSIRQAERVYKSVLQRHASSVKIVRLYAKFLEQIKQDPWAAARWFNEAERLEATEEDMKQQDTLGGAEVDDPALRMAMATGPMSGSYGHDNRGVIVMNAQSIIQMTNPAVHTMLGFSKTELQGKNLRTILPPKIADTHFTFVRNYIATGKSRILRHTRQQVAMHKDRSMLPIWLTVTNIKGIGEDAIFMGVMEPVQLSKDTATIWLMLDGTILTASDTFADWTGFNVGKEVLGQGLTGFVVKGMKQLDMALKRARAMQAAEDQRQLSLLSHDDAGSLWGSRQKGISLSKGSLGKLYPQQGSVIRAAHSQQSLPSQIGFVLAKMPEGDQTLDLAEQLYLAGSKSMANPSEKQEMAERHATMHKNSMPGSPVKSVGPFLEGAPQADLKRVGLVPEPMHDTSYMDLKRVGVYPQQMDMVQDATCTDLTVVVGPPSPGAASAAAAAAGMSPELDDEWMVDVVEIAHKYGNAIRCEVVIRNGGMGAMQHHVLTIKKVSTSTASKSDTRISASGTGLHRSSTAQLLSMERNYLEQDLMVVCDSKGQMVHITERLLDLLGRKHLSASKHGGLAGLDQIMVKPFAQLHKTLLQGVQPVTIPPYGCRSGLSVLLQGQGPQGQAIMQPYTLNISRKVVNDEAVHVTVLQERTLEQALDERRLLLEVNEFGIVNVLSQHTPASLLGCEPDKLQGKHVSSFLDVLRPPGTPAHTELDLLEQDHALTLLLEMVTPALHMGSACWRVGFLAPDAAPSNSESQTSAKVRGFLSGQLRPMVMRLRVKVAGGVETLDDGNVTIQMELWRADLCSSVIEVDKNGVIQPPEHLEVNALYPADLVLGGSEGGMLDQHIATYLPMLAQKQMSELMNEGVFGMLHQPPGMRRAEGKRSAMKNNKPAGVVGPAHVVLLQHYQDKGSMQVSLQAVRKSGHQTGYYLVLHPMKPTAGRSDLATWLLSRRQASPTPPTETNPAQSTEQGHGVVSRAARRRSSMLLDLNKRMLSAPPPLDFPSMFQRSSLPRGSAQRTSAGARFAEVVTNAPEPLPELEVPDLAVGVEGAAAPTAGDQAAVKLSKRDQELHLLPAPSKAALMPHEQDRVSEWLVSTRGHASGDQDVVSLPSSKQSEDGQANKEQDTDSSDTDASAKENEVDAKAATEMPSEAEDHQIDEGDYKRGQRFKKLFSLLSSTQVQLPVEKYRKWAYMLAAVICTIQLAAFITMYILLQDQTSMVLDLSRIGHGGVLATTVAVYTRALNIVYSNMTIPTLRLVSSADSLPYLQSLYIQAANDFKDMHRGAFLGYNKPRRLPDNYGLRALWEDSTLNVIETTAIDFNQFVNIRKMRGDVCHRSLGNFTVMRLDRNNVTTSLWQAGNMLAQKAANIFQNGDVYNASLNGDVMKFMYNPDLMWIIDNAPGAVFPGYLTTLDSYLELVISRADDVNIVQVILLILEGIAACSIISCCSWVLLERVAKQRYKAYHIFMLVPISLVRHLATKQYILGDEDEDDARDDRPEAVAKGLGTEHQTKLPVKEKSQSDEREKDSAGAAQAKSAASAPKMNIHVKHQAVEEEAAHNYSKGWLSAVKSFLSIGRATADVPESKRQLLPCRRTTAWLLWPFILWGVMNIISNSLGFMLLQATAGPVAMFNMAICTTLAPPYTVHTLAKPHAKHMNANKGGALDEKESDPSRQKELSHTKREKTKAEYQETEHQERVSLTFSSVTSVLLLLLLAVSATLHLLKVNYVNLVYARNNFHLQELTFEQDPAKMDAQRERCLELVKSLEKEYKVMLYGGQTVPNETSSHYRLVTEGLAYGSGDGPTILFNTQDCLCLNATECQSLDSHLYTDTRQGLDRMVIKYIEIGYTIPLYQYLDPYLNGAVYDYYWNTVPDITGGFSRLTSAYESFVVKNIASVTNLHITIFVLTLVLVLGFLFLMLRPFLRITTYEIRRIAELLSQLPPEVDITTLVQTTLLPQNGNDELVVAATVPKDSGKNMGADTQSSNIAGKANNAV